MKNSFLYILITAVLFTTLEPVSKLIAGDVSPMAMTCIRYLIGGVILLPFAIYKMKQQNVKLGGKDYGMLAFLGILCICVSMTLLQVAVKVADSPALIAIIFSSNSVCTILLAIFVLKEKLTVQKICALVLCILGVVACVDFKSGTNFISVLYALGAAVTFSLYTVLSKKYSQKISGMIQTSFSFFFGSLVLLCVLFFTGENLFAGVDSIENISILLYLGIAITGVGYWAFFKALETSSATAASTVFFIKPILAPFATWAINGIVPGYRVFLALILVVAGSVLTSLEPKEKAREEL